MINNLLEFLRINDDLNAEEDLLVNSLREFVNSEILPVIDHSFTAGIFPSGLEKKLAELGLLGSFIPSSFGGQDSNYKFYGLICRELERGDSAIRSFVSVQSSLVMYPILQYGSAEQKTYFLPNLAKANLIGCFGLTEPDHGSDPEGMKTVARKQGEKFILNGTKRWITNGDIADVAIIWAKLDDNVRGFIVEKGSVGFIQNTMKNKHSLRASNTGELILEDCEIPEKNLLIGSNGIKSALACLDSARFGIMWGALGAATQCFDTALDYASSRLQFGKYLSSFQLVQAKLVQMASDILQGQLLANQITNLRDTGRGHHTQTSLGKMNNVKVALECSRAARDILGANGISSEYPIMRHMLNLESVNTYEGTEDIHRLIIGRHLTGIAAFK
jgi:glutaryl-CoA dehydrogenase